jgi:hypothetical protein
MEFQTAGPNLEIQSAKCAGMQKKLPGTRGRSLVLLLAGICLASVTLSQVGASDSPVATSDSPLRTEPPPPSAYAGRQVCAECHRKESEFYGKTPHARDSAPADAEHILGSFAPGKNVLHMSNPNLIVAMTSEPNGFFQSGINMSDPNHPTGEAERFDISIGSGRHAQTYLYWQGDELYELPASYWRWNEGWVNSPGFPSNQIHFDRPIVPRCLECHGSYFQWLNPPANRFAKDSLVLGIDCERCHGPGAEHVVRERSATPPRRGSDAAIVNPARLPQDRQLGLCSLCHAGAVKPIGAPLRFLPGDDVRRYLQIEPAAPGAPVDVHGNQVGALEQSKCFRSGKMTCSTCHNVHVVQEDAASFSRHCLTCHAISACGKFKSLGAAIRTRCVDCHMPLLDSAKITTTEGEEKLHALLRAHQIAIYPAAAEEVERKLKGR